jgi:hypothetical protein
MAAVRGGSGAWSVLAIVQDALLLVDRENVLFANRAFEELCDTPAHELQLVSAATSCVLMRPEQRALFFEVVGRVLDGLPIRNDILVECSSKQAGAFLSRVAFYAYRDGSEQRCACVFTDPLFYHMLLETTSVFACLLEYVDTDLQIFHGNSRAQAILAPSVAGAVAAAALEGRTLKEQLGFQFDAEDELFFRSCRQHGLPFLKLIRVVAAAVPSLDSVFAGVLCLLL